VAGGHGAGDPQLAGWRLILGGERLQQARMPGQLRPGVVAEYLPGAGQGDVSPAALEERLTQLLLETLDGAR
jgi:hypothetical protein